MKMRSPLPLFAFFLFTFCPAHAQPIFTWATDPVDHLLSTASNWSGGSLPTSDSNAQLVFGPSNGSFIELDLPSIEIHSLAFTGSYHSYVFSASSYSDVLIGTGGISVPASAHATVLFDSNIYIGLVGNQTWDVGGHLTIRGMIGQGDFVSALTKTGAGTLRLESHNTFSGGLTVDAGTLEIGISSVDDGNGIYASPVGLGTLTLADHTTLRSSHEHLELHNNITLGDHVTLDSGHFDSLRLSGTLTATNAHTTVLVAGENPVLFTGTLDGPANTHLTFTSPVDQFGAAGFADVFSDNIKALTADRAALLFFAHVPDSITLHATNNGYISAAAAPPDAGLTPPSPAALLARIASPSTFAGTFGFDTHPDANLLHNYADDLDFSAFTHASFRIGSHSDALISGHLTAVDLGSTSLFPFGGGSGHLGVLSDLADTPDKPASVLVSTAAGDSPQYVIFRGHNTTTGTYSLDGVATHLAVENAIAVLDSAGALPGGAHGTFAFGATAPAYIGATEAAFDDFNDFLSHLAPGGHNPLSILGLDSHDVFDTVLSEGIESDAYQPRLVSQTIDLRNFTSIYLGTASDVIFDGTIYAPSDGILKLTAVDDGFLAIAAPFGSNVTSVEIGFPAGTAAPEFGDGEIEMSAHQTYAGGTTLYSGTLSLGASSSFDQQTSTLLGGPLGTGTLTVENGVSPAILAATDYYQSLHNHIVLNTDLQLGADNHDGYGIDNNNLALLGDISGSGGLRIFGIVDLAGHNTYTGGTVLAGYASLGSSNALGTGLIEITNISDVPATLSSYSNINLANPLSIHGNLSTLSYGPSFTYAGNLTLHRPVTLSFFGDNIRITGNIDGSSPLIVQNMGTTPIWLSGSNSYTGGTEIFYGSLVFGSPWSIPTIGLLRPSYSGYIGAGFNTNIQTNFLNRFDHSIPSYSSGSIGFDSTDVNDPIVVAENIDLSSFSLSTRLGTATAAILTGTITPPGLSPSSPYEFGGGGGILTVASNLTGARNINVSSNISAPLTLVLQGDNRNTTGLNVWSSIVRFDGAHALPSTGSLFASDYGYIGYTEAVVGLTPNDFMSRWSPATYEVILGFDSTDANAPRTIGETISLVYTSNFNSNTYIGTSTAVNLDGTLTPSGDTLRLTGVRSGRLVINSTLASPDVISVLIGTPIPEISAQGSVTLNAANTYTGGTDLLSSQLILGHASALGTGPLRVYSHDSRLSVTAQAAGTTVANAVHIDSFYHQLTLDGENNFTLSGELSGQGTLSKTGTSTVTLSGDNTELSGEVAIENGKLVFAGNTSAGTGTLSFWSELGIAEFLSDAPVLGGLSSHYAGSQILLAENSVLTVNLGSPAFSVDHPSLLAAREIEPSSATFFYGSIAGDGASVVYTTPADQQATLYLAGPSSYTGGTTINTGVTVHASDPAALGLSGPVNLHGGHLRVSSGTTLAFTSTRPLVFTSGSLGGGGTLSFESSLIIGAEHTLSPGNSIGVLSLSFNPSAALVLDSGGTYRWELSDATGTAGTGWDLIQIAGDVDVAALGGDNGVFNISIHTLDASGAAGFAANFNPYVAASWTILTATNIPDFNPAKFNLLVDSTTFLNATAGGTFSLSLVTGDTTSSILLNFTPVPEPSTWALMITGLAAVIVTTLRRRRRS
jgi:PEP-CTERM putative exosortase interaction domain/autotransporter-associated beta strand repeat